MAKLIYSAIASLDGYIADTDGKFDWNTPDEEVHRFVNDLERSVGTLLLGRRMYEVLVYWEIAHTDPDLTPAMQDFAGIWRAADKIVYSKTWTRRPARNANRARVRPEAVRQLKAAAQRDLTVAGRSWPRRRSGPGWSTSTRCLHPIRGGRWHPGLPTASASGSSCWTSAASVTARSSCSTRPALGGGEHRDGLGQLAGVFQ
jgi:dihydrofolate reductase